ncbi:GNT-I family protein, partial [Opisthorchis viverrini]
MLGGFPSMWRYSLFLGWLSAAPFRPPFLKRNKMIRASVWSILLSVCVLILLLWKRHPSIQHQTSTSDNVRNTNSDVPVLFESSDTATVNFTQSIPVLVIACKRTSVKRTLDALLKYRTNLISPKSASFPITVSQGCPHQPTANVLASYGSKISLIKFEMPPMRPQNITKMKMGYQMIAHHYKKALDYMFLEVNHSVVIVVEDDLDIAPDFFEYFVATLPLLYSDPSLFCVSAWNDNGRPQLIDPKRIDLIYRSDFFSGLGWMLIRKIWLEVRENWPDIFWDDYLRQPEVRKDRACLRPEVGRTKTFGRFGVSKGQYFAKYLESMHLNQNSFGFTKQDLSYLLEPSYTGSWLHTVYKEAFEISPSKLYTKQFPAENKLKPLRITYESDEEFVGIASRLTLMTDSRSGVMRNAFRGVVPIYWGDRRIYIAPPTNWKGYDWSQSWTKRKFNFPT